MMCQYQISVAAGSLWLTVTDVDGDEARIDDINAACTFRDKVKIGNIIVTIDSKRVMLKSDLTIGTDRMRELVIKTSGV